MKYVEDHRHFEPIAKKIMLPYDAGWDIYYMLQREMIIPEVDAGDLPCSNFGITKIRYQLVCIHGNWYEYHYMGVS